MLIVDDTILQSVVHACLFPPSSWSTQRGRETCAGAVTSAQALVFQFYDQRLPLRTSARWALDLHTCTTRNAIDDLDGYLRVALANR